MTDKEINNKCDGAICPHYRQCVLLQRKEQELKNEKEAARIDLEILNQACLDLRNELEEKEQECEELKKFYEEWNSQIPTITNTIGNLQLQTKAWTETASCYKQALEKIDNIVTSAGFGLDDKAILSLVKPILKIINEVKG